MSSRDREERPGPLPPLRPAGASLRVPAFPLGRHLSARVTPALLPLPVTANHITAVSLAAGLLAGALFSFGTYAAGLAGAMSFLASAVLDNCDGEIARAKGQSSALGHHFDSFVDWAVHAALLTGLGLGAARSFESELWWWLALLAVAGGTVDYGIRLFRDLRDGVTSAIAAPADGEPGPEGVGGDGGVLAALRELAQADFWLILLALAALGLAWVLLPLAAIGAQASWISLLLARGRDHHV